MIKKSKIKYWDIVILSPHFDDAVLSLGQHMVNWKSEGRKIKVITVFTRFGNGKFLPKYSRDYLIKSGFDSVKSFEEARIREDTEVMKKMRVNYEYWDFIDAGFRSKDNDIFLYPDKKKLLEGKINNIDKIIIKEIFEKINQIKTRYLLIPDGVGGHVDHILVKEVGEKMKRVKKLYYLESPYLWESLNFMKILKYIFRVKSLVVNLKNKDKLLERYKSQYRLWKNKNIFWEIIIK